jgi:hypothetical protein
MAMFDRYREFCRGWDRRGRKLDIMNKTDGFFALKDWYRIVDPILNSTETAISNHIMVINADNIYDYAVSQWDGQKELMSVGEMTSSVGAFSIMPPAEKLWVEFAEKKSPGRTIGFLIQKEPFSKDWYNKPRKLLSHDNKDIKDFTVINEPTQVFTVDCMQEISKKRRIYSPCLFTTRLMLDDEGSIATWRNNKSGKVQQLQYIEPYGELLKREPLFVDSTVRTFSYVYYVMVWCLAFCNTKNVVFVDSDTRKENAKRKLFKKKNLLPLVTVKVITIRDYKVKYSRENHSPSDPAGMAFHIVRGHFVDHREHGMFRNPNLKGIYWIPQHTRGDLEHGTVKKRYEIETGV